MLLCSGPEAKASPTGSADAALERDPEQVPDYGPTPACQPAGGDDAELKKRLARIERGGEPAAPTADSLTEGCLVPRDKISRSAIRAARAFGKRSSWREAAAYARLAAVVDPASSEARMVLAAARSRTGDIRGAIYQLAQWKASQRRDEKKVLAVLLWDPGLEALRARRAFWTWLNPPPPALVTSLREKPPALPLKDTKATFVLPQPVGSQEDLVYEPVRLSSANLRAVAKAISDSVGRPFRDYQLASSSDLSDAKMPDASAATGAHLFRFTPETRLLALSLTGSFGERGNDTVVSILAVEKGPGRYAVAELNCGRCGCHCRDSVLRVSRDRRAVAWFQECPVEGEPARSERCVVYADSGKLVKRCERLKRNEEKGGDGTMWRACTAADSDFNEDPGGAAAPSPTTTPPPAPSGPSEKPRSGAAAAAPGLPANCPPLNVAPVTELLAAEARRRNSAGMKQHRAGKTALAIVDFTTALRANPGHLLARYNLACAYARGGEPQPALFLLGELSRFALSCDGNAGVQPSPACAECKKILGEAVKDRDLESLRSLDEFKRITGAARSK